MWCGTWEELAVNNGGGRAQPQPARRAAAGSSGAAQHRWDAAHVGIGSRGEAKAMRRDSQKLMNRFTTVPLIEKLL